MRAVKVVVLALFWVWLVHEMTGVFYGEDDSFANSEEAIYENESYEDEGRAWKAELERLRTEMREELAQINDRMEEM